MHGNNRFRGAGARRLNKSGIDVERRRIDIDEYGFRAEPRNAACRREKRIGARDDFVAGTDADGHQRSEQCIGARRHAYRVPNLDEAGELSFEALDLWPSDETLRIADGRDRAQDWFSKRSILRAQIEQRNTNHDCV